MPTRFDPPPPDPALLERYLAGECAGADAERVRAWIEADPKRRETALGVQALDAVGELDGREADIDALWQTVRERVTGHGGVRGIGTPRPSDVNIESARMAGQVQAERGPKKNGLVRGPLLRSRIFGRGLVRQTLRIRFLPTIKRSAARWAVFGVLLCTVAGALITRAGWRNTTPTFAQHYQTRAGQRATVYLADGATLTLAPATNVGVNGRDVAVTGEVYFSVTPNRDRPFTVQTSKAIVHVLGTRFAVRQYPSESASRIVVDDGKIAVRSALFAHDDHDRTVLTAHSVAVVGDSGISVQQGIAVSDYTVWTKGRLVFQRVPLRRVLEDLSRAYATTVQVTDTTLANIQVTTTANVASDPLTSILDDLTFTIRAHYTRVGGTFLIVPGVTSHGTQQQHKQFPQLERQYGL